jgi:hypothetical protein
MNAPDGGSGDDSHARGSENSHSNRQMISKKIGNIEI